MIFENEELNLRSNNVRNYNDSVHVVKEFDNIIKCKKKWILNLAFKQGLLFKKFKGSNRFKETLNGIGISKSIIYIAKLTLEESARKVSITHTYTQNKCCPQINLLYKNEKPKSN